MLVNLNAKSAYVIGVGFDMVDMIGLVADLKCNILTEVRRRRPSESGKALVDNLISVVDDLLRKSSVEKDRIKGIGLAVAGVIEAETVFSWPGIGRLAYDAVMKRDYPLLQGVFLIFAVAVVLANLTVDLIYSRIDPRIKTGAVND